MNDFDFCTPVNSGLVKLATERNDKLIGFGVKTYAPGRACDYRSFLLHCGHTQDIRTSHYRNNDYACQVCFNQDLHTNAELNGLKLVSLEIVQNCCDRLYERECGHTIIHNNSYLKNHVLMECQECIREEVEINLRKNNYSLLEKVHNGYLVQCNHCKNKTVSNTPVARNGCPRCSNCFSDLLQKDAQASGFTYLNDTEPLPIKGKPKGQTIRWYSCNKCLHVDNYSHGSMRLGHVTCDNCYLNKRVIEAACQGMVYMGHSKGQFHKYKLSCGCIRDFSPQCIKDGIWTCKVHGNTFYHRPSGIYLIEMKTPEFSWLKFGFAKDLNIRLKGYGLPSNCTSEIIFHVLVDTGYEAMASEKLIHKEISEFKLSPVLMKSYMTVTGHTECYPVGTKELIISKMEELYGKR